VTVIILMSILMVTLLSPIKVAFSVTTLSVIVRLISYSARSSVFPASAITISFSSGIIILFCYCAIITSFERKRYRKLILGTLVVALPVTLRITENLNLSRVAKTSINLRVSPLLARAIGVILVCIVSINSRIFSPSKSIISSY